MARQNPPFIAFNRGIISPKALARVDVDRTALSAAEMNNWVPKTQGAMGIRPGTKYLGSSRNDAAATWIEFVAAADQTALLELTNQKMRVWIDDAVLTRPTVATTMATITGDTGLWSASASTGGGGMNIGSFLDLFGNNIGGVSRARRRNTLSDTGAINIEHGLRIRVHTGPVTFRCGSDTGGDQYIAETELDAGYHHLAFTPSEADFHLQFESRREHITYIAECSLDTGTVEITTPWDTGGIGDVRWDQSADVVFTGATGVAQRKIERRGDGRSWSVAEYAPENGPFLPGRTSEARLKVAKTFGDTTMTADQKFFTSDHVGAIFRLTHNGQNGSFPMAREDTETDPIRMTGVDTGTTFSVNQERSIRFQNSAQWVGRLTVQRSYDGEDIGFHDTSYSDTGTFDIQIQDQSDNLTVWYRGKIKTGHYTSGTCQLKVTYGGGGKTGVCRITGYTSPTQVDVDVLSRFAPEDTGTTASDWTSDWNEGAWSPQQGYPDAVALSEGRLWWAGGTQIWGSVSDDYGNFDDETEGDAGPIARAIGRGPVNRINFLLPGAQLLIGTAGSEIAMLSSALGETLTPTNALARTISTQGSAALRAILVDTQGIFVQRAGNRVYALTYDAGTTAYGASDLTKLVPDLMSVGVRAVAVQRQPDTRLHFVLADGTAAMLSYDEVEELLCWSTWSTDGTIENVAVLPGSGEDQVYFHIKRTINGQTKRYLERMAMESECVGGPLNWIADCAKSYEGVATTAITGFSHLEGANLVAWANDTGQGSTYGMDMSTDTGSDGSQKLYTVSGGAITLPVAKTKVVAGLPYEARYCTTKLAYAASLGTALTMPKRVHEIGFILYQTHNNGLFYGGDTGALDPLPRNSDKGGEVDDDKIFPTLDITPFAFPGEISEDARIWLKAKAPRPVTVLAAVPGMETSDR